MHYVYFHVYLLLIGALLGFFVDPFSIICIVSFYLMFVWFHICVLLETSPMDFNTGAYCPRCQRVTGLALRHCDQCDFCVPSKWIHCRHLQRCCDRHLRKRWVNLFKLILLIYTFMSVIYALTTPWLLVLIPMHVFVLKSTYK